MLECESVGVAFRGELFFALHLLVVMVMRPEPESILRNYEVAHIKTIKTFHSNFMYLSN